MTLEQLYTLGMVERQSSEASDSVHFATHGDFHFVNLAECGIEKEMLMLVDVPSTPDAVCPTLYK